MTTKVGHTPGPWHWGCWVHNPERPEPSNIGAVFPWYTFLPVPPEEDRPVLSGVPYGTETEGARACVLDSWGDYGYESGIVVGEADAVLIAAAPTLLAACEAALETCDITMAVRRQMEAAIALARKEVNEW